MESGKYASVQELRTVRARSIKCQLLERERINSASSSPIKSFTTLKNLESTQREIQKIRGFDKDLSEGDKWLMRAKDSGSRRWLHSSVMREKLDVTSDSHSDTEAKVAVGRKWGKCVEFSGRQFRGCAVAEREEYFYLLADLEVKKLDRGIDESILLEYFDGDVQSCLSAGFLCYLSQLEYRLNLPLTNLAKGIMIAIGACPVQLNGNMWEVITVCDHLNEKWQKEGKVRRITPVDVLQFYGVKNFKASGGLYFCASVTRHRFFDMNSAGRTWNDNIIWVKVNCLQKDDEEPLNLRFRTVKQSGKSKVKRKEFLLNEVAAEKTELKLVLVLVQPNPVVPRKIALKYPKKRMLKALLASDTPGSGEVTKFKRRRVEPSGESRDKVAEVRSAAVDGLKEVEERARLAVLHGEEDLRKMAARLVKGIWLGIEEEKSKLKKANVELEKELARSRTNALKEVRQLKASHAVAIGYSEEEVDAIKADTYVEEKDEEEAKTVGIVDGLDDVSCQTALDNHGDDVELPEGGSKKAIARAKKVEAKERSRRSRTEVKTPLVQGDVVSLSGQIRDLESDVSRIQGHIQKGNANLRECKHKFDAALIREKVLEREIKAKKSLVKRKE
ncbi:hypothetical protein GIB67_039617 [Kingdonia uniflora]|uniref:Uncharacterized protein n=1 Tax=Kingdonia uniflora TaxID=39325 RepID=A0A7J7MDP1_9MAGN|nr:hypothetical protein GIB67_039617 [Kingdonia uniflora]